MSLLLLLVLLFNFLSRVHVDVADQTKNSFCVVFFLLLLLLQLSLLLWLLFFSHGSSSRYHYYSAAVGAAGIAIHVDITSIYREEY